MVLVDIMLRELKHRKIGGSKKMIKTDRAQAFESYKQAKVNYLNDPIKENWLKFCNMKVICMRLGIRI